MYFYYQTCILVYSCWRESDALHTCICCGSFSNENKIEPSVSLYLQFPYNHYMVSFIY